MPYRFGDTQLRVVHSFAAENRAVLGGVRFLILEHVLPTTLEFVRLLKHFGAEVFGFVAKPYSVDQGALERMRALGVNPIVKASYREIEDEGVTRELLLAAQQKSQEDNKKIVIIDVGGYFAEPLATAQELPHVAGVVEDTTFGHNRYKAKIGEIRVPVASVARSELKEIEARFVGKDAVVSMDLILRQQGVSISGRNALVIGYGMIGKNVARTLRRYDLKVFVYDVKDTMNLKAHTDGFGVHQKQELLKRADIIFSATGTEAIAGNPRSAVLYDEMVDHCKNGVILASVGSRKSEFEVERLKEQATRSEKLSDELIRYKLSKGEDILVAMDGSAVNFHLPSIPIEILDLVFAEIMGSCLRLIDGRTLATGVINETPSGDLDRVAKQWLRFANHL